MMTTIYVVTEINGDTQTKNIGIIGVIKTAAATTMAGVVAPSTTSDATNATSESWSINQMLRPLPEISVRLLK